LKFLITISTTLLLISCIGHGNSSSIKGSADGQTKTDTIKYYSEPDFSSYTFDTVVNQTTYSMKTFCLNDSSVYNETFSEARTKRKNIVEYSVAHNYETDFVIKQEKTKTIKLQILKENFKDSLQADFYKICHMWKNEYSYCDNGQLIFRATLAQPDTDYQIAVLYTISDKGKFKIIRVEDESYNGDEDE